MTKRLLIFGDGEWATNSLKRLLQEKWEIAGIVARVKPTDPKLLKLAKEFRLPVFQPANVNRETFVSQVNALQPDLNISISYDQILQKAIRETAPLGFINFHAGKLPQYRGRNVINWAIINGETEIGLTAHFVDDGIDTGDIIVQRTLPITWTDTYQSVLNKVIAAFPDLVSETVHKVVTGNFTPIRQAHLPGTYFAARGEGDEWLNWEDTSVNIYRKIRAITHPGPGARTLLGNRPVIIWKAQYDPSWPKYMATPGQVVGKRPNGVIVKTGDSTILITKVQIENEQPQTPKWRIGTRLGINQTDILYQLINQIAQLERKIQEISENKGQQQ
ncbi:methionyl-tRNA formyltransferase [Candidatus Parcubacteria bacterium]|nr:MAG: methionyl-tRNA formyltransferase [Candidatus Parcubacteria bacterium]